MSISNLISWLRLICFPSFPFPCSLSFSTHSSKLTSDVSQHYQFHSIGGDFHPATLVHTAHRWSHPSGCSVLVGCFLQASFRVHLNTLLSCSTTLVGKMVHSFSMMASIYRLTSGRWAMLVFWPCKQLKWKNSIKCIQRCNRKRAHT